MCIIIQNTECFSWILILTNDTFRSGKVSPIACGGMLLWRLSLCDMWAVQSHKQHWSDKIRSLCIRNFVCGNTWTCKYFTEQYAAFQNVLFVLLVNKHCNASKLATGSMLMSASCKVFTIDTHKSVAFWTNIMLMQCEGQSPENNIRECSCLQEATTTNASLHP